MTLQLQQYDIDAGSYRNVPHEFDVDNLESVYLDEAFPRSTHHEQTMLIGGNYSRRFQWKGDLWRLVQVEAQRQE